VAAQVLQELRDIGPAAHLRRDDHLAERSKSFGCQWLDRDLHSIPYNPSDVFIAVGKVGPVGQDVE
jgi:hypothetical protein